VSREREWARGFLDKVKWDLTVDSYLCARELYVSPDEGVYARRYPWLGERRRERIPAASVKEVFVEEDIEHVNTDSGVEIRGRGSTIKIGQHFQGRGKTALQKLVTHVLGLTEEQGEGTTN